MTNYTGYKGMDFILNSISNATKSLNWQGWSLESGMTKLEWFDNGEITRKCNVQCNSCGFFYLDINGQELTDNGTPLCGER
jgi:hypothetical protein